MNSDTSIRLEEIGEHTIDIEKVLIAKGLKPNRLVVKLLNRLLHVDELNAGIYNNREYVGVDFAKHLLDYLDVKVEVQGIENIPINGSPLIVGNHPLGGPDGIALIAVAGERRKDVLFPVNDFLMYLPNLRPIFIPIDKVHHNHAGMRRLEEAFAGNNALLYFPAGLCSRRVKGKIVDMDWKATFIKKAMAYNREIVPFYVEARNRRRFYTIAKLRKCLGIKFNFEMALLPGEMFAQRGKTFRITIGKPISPRLFDGTCEPSVWAQKVKEHVYRLKHDPSCAFQV